MADTYNSVPLGQSGTGRAVVLNQAISTNPTSIWQQQNKFNAAQKAAEERARVQQQKDNDAKWKDMLFDPPKVGAIAQAELDADYSNFIGKHSALMKKSNGGAISLQDKAAMQEEKAAILSKANFWSQAPTELSKIATGYKSEKYLNQDVAEAKLINSVRDENGKLKPPAKIDLQQADAELRQNPESYNKKELVNTFLDDADKFYSEQFGKNKRFDFKTETEANLPIKLNPDGTAQRDSQGRLGIIVNDSTVERAKNYPPINNYLTGLRKQREQQLANGEITEIPDIKQELSSLLQDYAYSKTTTTQNRIPVGKAKSSGSQSNKKQPSKSNVGWFEVGLSGKSDVTSHDANGNWLPKQSAIVSPSFRYNTDKNDKPYVRTITSTRVINLNADDEINSIDNNNRNSLKLELGPTVVGIIGADNKPIFAPGGLSGQEMQQWVRKEIRNRNGNVKVGYFATGVVADKENVDLDMANAGEGESSNAGMAPNALLSGTPTKVKQTNRRVMLPLTEFVRGQMPADLLPDGDMQTTLSQLQHEVNRAKTQAPPYIAAPKQSKVVANLPKPPAPNNTKNKTSIFVKNLGKNS